MILYFHVVHFGCKQKDEGEKQMAAQRKDRHKPETRRAWCKRHQQVQLRIPRSMAHAMRARASSEALPLATWIRRVCLKELKRER